MKSRILASALAVGLLATAAPAMADGSFGVKIGTGVSFYQDEDPTLPSGADDPEIMPFALGIAYVYDLVLLAIEVDALWWRNSADFGGSDATEDRLAIPVIAKITLPLVPTLLGLDLGLGLEPRFHLASDPENDDAAAMVMYLPVVVGANLSLAGLGVGLEARYEHQLTESTEDQDDRVHQLMFFGGVMF